MNLNGPATAVRKGTRNAYTIVEVIVSVAVLAIVMAGAYRIIVQSANLSRSARNHYVAISIAKNRLEQLRALTFDDLELAEELKIRVNERGIPDANGIFLRTTAISDPYYNSRIVLVRVDCPRKYRRPDIRVDISTILMDQTLVLLGGGS